MRVTVPLALDFGQARAAVASGGRLVNIYAQRAATGAKDATVLVGAPGTKERARLTYLLGPESVMHQAIAAYDKIVVVAQHGTYIVSGDMTWTRIGAGMAGPVSMAWNGIDVAAVNGTSGVWITETTVTTITDADFYPADTVTVLNGFLIFNRKGTGQAFCTEPYSREFQGLSFATAEKNPDKTVGVFAERDNLAIFGELTTELWYPLNPAPATGFPFARIPGGVIGHGCASPATVAATSEAVFWLSNRGLVIEAVSAQPRRVSDDQIEAALKERRDDWATARGFAYEDEGHAFYALTVGDATFVYDVAMGLWHERANYSRGQHIAQSYVFAFGRHFVGDDTGRLLEMSTEHLDDAGEPLVGEIVSMPYHADREFLSVFSFELQTDPGVSPAGADAKVLMSFSDDQGRTWNDERPASIGRTGHHKQPLIWRRLGAAKDRRFRFRMSDPFRRAFLAAAYMEV